MKKLFLLLMLITLVACNGGGSSGGSSTAEAPIPENLDEVYEYRLFVRGAAGSQFVSLATRNFGDADMADVLYSYTLDASQSIDNAVFGRSIYWNIERVAGSGDIEIYITKDGVEVARDVLTFDGETAVLSEGI